MDVTPDAAVLGLVIAARLLVPLLIPWFPLPGVVAALLLDAVDQTLFEGLTTYDLAWYQGYDKALDIYYLSIAYIAAVRNWTNLFAFRVARFLFYFRLAGVALFELLEWRPLLFVFPNTFEYFFIWYELFALRYDPRRLARTTVIGAAAAIWLVIKLPQEYWIHIARLDVTDVLKTAVFGAPPETPWGHVFRAAPWLFVGISAAAVALIVALAWLAGRRLPPAQYGLSFRGQRDVLPVAKLATAQAGWAAVVFDRDLLEKVVLVSLISGIFAQILPDVRAGTPQIVLAVAVMAVANAGVSHRLARRGLRWRNTFVQFAAMTAVNVALVLLFRLLPGARDMQTTRALFFVLLLSLIVTLFDRFQVAQRARFAGEET